MDPAEQCLLIHAQEEQQFESDIDMSLSNCSIGADAPAAAFGKTVFTDFASAGYKPDPVTGRHGDGYQVRLYLSIWRKLL